VTEVRAQIKEPDDAGAVGWMLWNPPKRLHRQRAKQKEASGPSETLLVLYIDSDGRLLPHFVYGAADLSPTSSAA